MTVSNSLGHVPDASAVFLLLIKTAVGWLFRKNTTSSVKYRREQTLRRGRWESGRAEAGWTEALLCP